MPLAPLRIAILIGALASPMAAQTGYRNLDGGRPVRVEDARPTELNELEIELPTLRLERVNGGFYRWRVEPKLSYGLRPHAEVELRVPFVYREGAVSPRGGLAGVGVSGAYALNTETLGLPALMVGAEALLPVGPAASPVAAGSLRAMMTRTFSFARLHANGSFGNYGVVRPPVFVPDTTGGPNTPPTTCPPGTIRNSQGTCVTLPPDLPCIVAARPGGGQATTFACRPNAGAALVARAARRQQAPDTATVFEGTRWAAGLGIDRAFALRSLLVVGDVFVEQLRGLGRPTEWTGELGARRQTGVRTVLDAGWGRRFTGPDQSWYVNAGITYAIGIPATGVRR